MTNTTAVDSLEKGGSIDGNNLVKKFCEKVFLRTFLSVPSYAASSLGWNFQTVLSRADSHFDIH